MNAQRLLAHYEKVAEAPDAIPRLRRFILDLAVRGKLVTQDPSDQPASELLERIAADKADRAVSARDRRATKIRPLASEDTPFPVPPNWVWASFGDITISRDGERVPVSREERERRAKVYDYYGASGIIDKIDGFLFDKPLLLIGEDGANLINRSTPIAFIARGKYWVNNHAHVLDGLSEGFLRYLEVFINALDLKPYVTGTAQPKMNQAKMNSIPVALPPIAEQHRLVAKVDELMSLCDWLEAARAGREAARDRLAAASLARLNETHNVTFQDDARFALDELPALTTRPDQIKVLRQTILNLAVRGKLVPQDPNDEPASGLLKRIRPLPKPPRFDKRSPELIPGDCGLSVNHPGTLLPKGWQWVPMVQVARLESGHTPSRNRLDWWNGDVPWIGLVDARAHNNGRIFETTQHTNEAGLANSAARLLPKGTVCFSRTASVGYVVIMGRPMATSQDFVNWVPTEAISSEWLQLVMIAERPAISRFSKGAVHQTIYYSAWLAMHVALPPLAEQHRIVANVDALMALCDRLEASLSATAATRRRLLDALLAEALAPAGERELEAAE